MLDRTIAPKALNLENLSIPKFKIENLSGVPVLTREYKEQPLIYFELILDSGRVKENIPGVSWFAIKMLMEGTLSRTSQQLSNAIESLGSFIEVGAGMDSVSIKLYSLKKNAIESLKILEEILTKPSFPQNEFDILKNIRIRNIENMLAKNSQFSSLKFSEKLYGEQHAYGRILTGERVNEVTLNDTRNFYKEILFTEPKIILGGDLSNEIVNHIERLLQNLSFYSEKQSFKFTTGKAGEFRLKRENSNQASVRIGNITIDKSAPDIHTFSISNTLLGGFFGSRLMKSVREEKGLTYGIYSSLVHQKYSSYRVISAEIQYERMEEALEAIYFEIDQLKKEPPGIQEVETLRNYLIGKLQNSMDSLFSILSLQKELFINGLDSEFLRNYFDVLMKIEPVEISESINKYFQSQEDIRVIAH